MDSRSSRTNRSSQRRRNSSTNITRGAFGDAGKSARAASNSRRSTGSKSAFDRDTQRPSGSLQRNARSRGAASSAAGAKAGNERARVRTVRQINKQANADKKRAARVDRLDRAKKATRIPFIIIGIIVGVVVIVMASVFFLSRTEAFEIENIDIQGVDHLTSSEIGALVSIPQGTTLLSVDSDSIERNLKRVSWVEEVKVNRVFPNTLEIIVSERQIEAIAEIPMGQTQTIQNWAISTDHVWLMAIPSKESETGQKISDLIYSDAEQVLHIVDVPYGIEPKMGEECTNADILNALSIISGLTTELADEVKVVSASDQESTSLILDNNIEIAFGMADNIREKERICMEIMKDNPTVVYINVRVVDRPTWRAASTN